MDKIMLRALIKAKHNELKALWPVRKALPFGHVERARVALRMAIIRVRIARWRVELMEAKG